MGRALKTIYAFSFRVDIVAFALKPARRMPSAMPPTSHRAHPPCAALAKTEASAPASERFSVNAQMTTKAFTAKRISFGRGPPHQTASHLPTSLYPSCSLSLCWEARRCTSSSSAGMDVPRVPDLPDSVVARAFLSAREPTLNLGLLLSLRTVLRLW